MTEKVPATITTITSTSISVNAHLPQLVEKSTTVVNGILSQKAILYQIESLLYII